MRFIKKLQSKSDHIIGTTVIQNNEDLQRIIDLTKNLVKNANHELKFSEIHYASTSTSWFFGIISAASIFRISAVVITGIFYKCNLFNCILRAIIKRSTDVQVEHDGTLTLGLPTVLVPKLDIEQPIHNQLNNHTYAHEMNQSHGK